MGTVVLLLIATNFDKCLNGQKSMSTLLDCQKTFPGILYWSHLGRQDIVNALDSAEMCQANG